MAPARSASVSTPLLVVLALAGAVVPATMVSWSDRTVDAAPGAAAA